MGFFKKIGKAFKKSAHFVSNTAKKGFHAVSSGAKKGLHFAGSVITKTRDFATDTLKKVKDSANPFDMKGLLPVLLIGLGALIVLPNVLDSATKAKKEFN